LGGVWETLQVFKSGKDFKGFYTFKGKGFILGKALVSKSARQINARHAPGVLKI
jgi:hypothetical protein